MKSNRDTKAAGPVSAAVLALRGELANGLRPVGSFAMGEREVDVCAGKDAIWAIVRRAGKGGLALRLAHCPGGPRKVRKARAGTGEQMRLRVDGSIGSYSIVLRASTLDLGMLRATVELVPAADLLVPFHPARCVSARQ